MDREFATELCVRERLVLTSSVSAHRLRLVERASLRGWPSHRRRPRPTGALRPRPYAFDLRPALGAWRSCLSSCRWVRSAVDRPNHPCGSWASSRTHLMRCQKPTSPGARVFFFGRHTTRYTLHAMLRRADILSLAPKASRSGPSLRYGTGVMRRCKAPFA